MTTQQDAQQPSAAKNQNRRTMLTGTAGLVVGVAALSACGTDEEQPTNQPPPKTGERIAALADVPVGHSTVVNTPDGKHAVLTRKDANSVSALSAVCTHQGCTVQAQGQILHCPCHGSEFDPNTGAVRHGPATKPLPPIKVKISGADIVTT